MRKSIISAVVVLLFGTSLALAQGPSRVIVAPFTEANEQQQPDWINRAIHQAVMDELASLSGVELVSVPEQGAPPVTTAQAKGAGAEYVVRGAIQRVDGQLRVTGRVEKVDDGKTVGGFKATGPQQQLFAIEDEIARQLKRVLAPMEADLPILEGARPVVETTATLPSQPLRGVYEGSDLQRALHDRDYLRRAARRVPEVYDQPTYYPPPQQPLYPYTVGIGGTTYPWYYPYGFGHFWGWPVTRETNVVIIKKPGDKHDGGHGGGGVVVSPPTARPRISVPALQTQRIRNTAVNPGQSGNFVGPTPPPPGLSSGGGR